MSSNTKSSSNSEEEAVVSASSERPIRSLVKAFSWRVTGSVDTLLLSWFFTGSLKIAAAIGSTEVITKMVLYYLHERAWNRVNLGRDSKDSPQQTTISTGYKKLKSATESSY
jgi:uncharacterized membrane protein